MTQRAATGLALAEGDTRKASLDAKEYVATVLAQAPPLTSDQMGRLRQLLTIQGEPHSAGPRRGGADLTASLGRAK